MQKINAKILLIDEDTSSGLIEALPETADARQTDPENVSTRSLREFSPDIVLINFDSPLADLDLVRHIRSEKSLPHLRIVGVTKTEFKAQRLDAYAAGVNDFMTSGNFSMQELACKLNCLLRAQFLENANHLKGELIELVKNETYSPFGPIIQASRQLQDIPEFNACPQMMELLQNVDTASEDFVKRLELLQEYFRWNENTEKQDSDRLPQVATAEHLLATQIPRWQETANEFSLRLVLPETLPEDFILIEIMSIRRILRWVVDNAIIHAHAEVQIKAGIHQASNQLFIDIIDDGDGFPADILPYVFTGFLPGNRLNVDHGMGLHLSLAQKIVEQQDGSLSIKDAGPGTTTIQIAFPIMD